MNSSRTSATVPTTALSDDLRNTEPSHGPRYEDDFIRAQVLGRTFRVSEDQKQSDQTRGLEKRFLADYFGLPEARVFMLEQVHGAVCLPVTRSDTAGNEGVFFGKGDALVTEDPGLLLCVRTADCMPVFFAAYRGSEDRPTLVGIAHAGWRGLRDGIIESALDMARARGLTRFRLFRGPCIGGDVYEVGPEVAREFEITRRNDAPSASTDSADRNGDHKGDRETYLLDLRANATARLGDFLTPERYFDETLERDFRGCTMRDNDLYYSHRKGDAGRNLNVIMLKSIGEAR